MDIHTDCPTWNPGCQINLTGVTGWVCMRNCWRSCLEPGHDPFTRCGRTLPGDPPISSSHTLLVGWLDNEDLMLIFTHMNTISYILYNQTRISIFTHLNIFPQGGETKCIIFPEQLGTQKYQVRNEDDPKAPLQPSLTALNRCFTFTSPNTLVHPNAVLTVKLKVQAC